MLPTTDLLGYVDLLRLLVVPFFAWAAYTDVKTRRIPNEVWGPLFGAGVIFLVAAVAAAYDGSSGFAVTRELVGIAVSLGVVAPVAYLFWLFGGFGGADAKALLVLSLLLPVYPTYDVPVLGQIPMHVNGLGSFAFTILTNTVIVGVLFPLSLFGKNALAGEFSLPMFLGERVPARTVDEKYGTIMGTNDGMESGSLDLDALRMYLAWRDESLDAIIESPGRLRDPDSLPDARSEPGSGQVATDGGTERDRPDAVVDEESTASGDDEETAAEREYDDPWGAEAFLAEIEGDAYGTTPEALRDGLDVLVTEEAVWVSPGIPFIVPMFFGLVVSLTVGDLTTAAIELL